LFYSSFKYQLRIGKKTAGLAGLFSLIIVSIAYFIQLIGTVFPNLATSRMLGSLFVTVYGAAYFVIVVSICIFIAALVLCFYESWFSQEGLFYRNPPVRIHSALLASICNTTVWTVLLILIILSEILMTQIVALSALRTVSNLSMAVSTGFYSYDSIWPVVFAVIFEALGIYFFFVILIMLAVTAGAAIRKKFMSLFSVLGALVILCGRFLLHNAIASIPCLSNPKLYAEYGVNTVQLCHAACDLLFAIAGYFLIYLILKKKMPYKTPI